MILFIILFVNFLLSVSVNADEKNNISDSGFIVSYFNSLTETSQIILYGNELLKRGLFSDTDKIDTILSLVIPKILEFENYSNISYFYLIFPTNFSSVLQYDSAELKFEFSKSKKELILNSSYIGNLKSKFLDFSIFKISLSYTDKNKIDNAASLTKKARLNNNALLQIKINEIFSAYKIYNLSQPVYYIGAATKYQGQNLNKINIGLGEKQDSTFLDTPTVYPETYIKTGVDLFNVSDLSKLPEVGNMFIPQILPAKSDSKFVDTNDAKIPEKNETSETHRIINFVQDTYLPILKEQKVDTQTMIILPETSSFDSITLSIDTNLEKNKVIKQDFSDTGFIPLPHNFPADNVKDTEQRNINDDTSSDTMNIKQKKMKGL